MLELLSIPSAICHICRFKKWLISPYKHVAIETKSNPLKLREISRMNASKIRLSEKLLP